MKVPLKISLIEDDPDCCKNYSDIFCEQGHDVKAYSNADDVINNIEQIASSDRIILDLMMQLGTIIKDFESSETGIAILKRIRNINKDVPIIILTAREKSEIWEECAPNEDDNVRYLGKPICEEDLLKETEEWSNK